MDLYVEQVNGAVVLNIKNVCTAETNECRDCIDIGGLVHNWLMQNELRYVIIDLQDEKDVCRSFLIELLQLRKRLRIPFLFSGVMKRPRKLLEEYDFFSEGTPVFVTPEEAIEYLREYHEPLLNISFEGIQFGEPILSLRARQLQRAEQQNEDALEAEADA